VVVYYDAIVRLTWAAQAYHNDIHYDIECEALKIDREARDRARELFDDATKGDDDWKGNSKNWKNNGKSKGRWGESSFSSSNRGKVS